MHGLLLSKTARDERDQLNLIIRSLLLLRGVEPSKGEIKALARELRPTVSHGDLMNADPVFLERADRAVHQKLGLSFTKSIEPVRPQSGPSLAQINVRPGVG